MTTLSEATAAARRDLTLDLYTKQGPFWEAIAGLREGWGIESVASLPPSPPPGSAVTVGLLNAGQMPERFHLPPEPTNRELLVLVEMNAQHPGLFSEAEIDHMQTVHRRLTVALWLNAIRDTLSGLRRSGALAINPSGTDDLAWQRWSPFLSACACYDPPEADLLAFAAHDDRPIEAAGAKEITFWRDAEVVQRAERRLSERLLEVDQRPEPARFVATMAAYLESIASAAAAWQPSTAAPPPRRRVGRESVDPLLAVQCAIFAGPLGWTEPRIGEHFGWTLTPDSYGNPRRCKKARHAIGKGRGILAERAI